MFEKLHAFSESLGLLASGTGVSFWWYFRNQDIFQYVLPDQYQSPYGFCTRIKEAPFYGLSRCRHDHMEQAFREALLKRETFLLTCHAGLVFAVIPFFLSEELIGVLFAGPVRVSENSHPELAESFAELPFCEKQKLFSLGKYLEHELEERFSEPDNAKPDFRLLPRLKTQDKQILACAHLMRKRSRKKITAREIALSCGIGESSLLHRFKAETGIPFSEWLMRLRVSDALRLIEGTDLPFSDVASTCGFSDQSRMIVLFRRYLARTPGELRRKSKRLPDE